MVGFNNFTNFLTFSKLCSLFEFGLCWNHNIVISLLLYFNTSSIANKACKPLYSKPACGTVFAKIFIFEFLLLYFFILIFFLILSYFNFKKV